MENKIKQEIITRIEVIDENGRSYVRWNTSVQLSVQDDGKTLKIFVAPEKKKTLN